MSLAETSPEVDEIITVGDIWAGHDIAPTLLTCGDHQWVAFYNGDRILTIAQRRIEESTFRTTYLDSTLGWDSHNRCALGIDPAGHIHLAGNMHASPLHYWRSKKPLDSSSLQKIPKMTGGIRETVMTYPAFFHGRRNAFLFTYRLGWPSRGRQIVYSYELATQRWRDWLGCPFTDGEKVRNAYFYRSGKPTLGPDGCYHMAWVWRDGAALNGDNCCVSYAKSDDLKHWYDSAGSLLRLPITLDIADIVDPVPVRSGLLNGNIAIGFDNHGAAVISYHKFDENGFTQLYNARRENGQWVRRRATDWPFRWEINGSGSGPAKGITVHPVGVGTSGRLVQEFEHSMFGRGVFVLDHDTLMPQTILQPTSNLDGLSVPESSWPGMTVLWTEDDCVTATGPRYRLRRESLPTNRDRPRDPPWPPPTP